MSADATKVRQAMDRRVQPASQGGRGQAADPSSPAIRALSPELMKPLR